MALLLKAPAALLGGGALRFLARAWQLITIQVSSPRGVYGYMVQRHAYRQTTHIHNSLLKNYTFWPQGILLTVLFHFV